MFETPLNKLSEYLLTSIVVIGIIDKLFLSNFPLTISFFSSFLTSPWANNLLLSDHKSTKAKNKIDTHIE